MTIGIDTLSSGHKASEYKFWDIEKYTSPPSSLIAFLLKTYDPVVPFLLAFT